MIIYPKILFISNKDDLALDYLILKFQNKGIEYFRINSEDITKYGISFDLKEAVIDYKDKTYNLSKVVSAYFRRAPSIFPKTEILENLHFVNNERRDFLEGLYLTLDNVKWINPIFETYIAEKKTYQITLAKRLGFNIPQTVFTNNSDIANNFINNHDNNIIKPICHGLQITKSGAYSIYTSDIQSIDTNVKLFESPIYLQEKIKTHRDIRATVIGSKIFAVEIESFVENRVDWRRPEIKKKYSNHNLPSELKRRMLNLNTKLGLQYSAFDFILTEDSNYKFLETNPAGEWVWLENELNIPISNAIIDELIKTI